MPLLRVCLTFLTLTFYCCFLAAQVVTDDFSDGNLLNPDYQGDTQNFVVEDSTLRLMAPAAGSSELFLSLTTDPDQTVTYEILVRLDFATSSSNFAAFTISGESLDEGLVTYWLKVGGISGSDDALVFSADYGTVTGEVLINGSPGAVGTDPVLARIRLQRSAENVWSLFADYSGGTNFLLEGSSPDPLDATVPLDRFAIRCAYTTTRTDKFYFDDLSIGPILVDETPPVLLSVAQGSAANQLLLTFNEVISGPQVASPANYTFSPSGIEVNSAVVNGNTVLLTLQEAAPIGVDISVIVGSVEDNSGNVATGLSASLFIPVTTIPSAANLIITEFMADPTPVVGQPDAEYVEIYNRGDTVILLNGLGIASGGTGQDLGNVQIAPGAYRTIVGSGNAGLFPAAANVITVSSLPSLSNAGDQITLIYNGNIIQQIDYDESWYNDAERDEGGFSLELSRLDAQQLNCAGLWAASRSPQGGTPGGLNSLDGVLLDTVGPQLLTANFVAGGVRLIFSEALATNIDLGAFSINPDLGIVDIIQNTDVTSYLLATTTDPQESTLYTITVDGDVQDCAGNFSDTTYNVQLGLAQEVALGDVVINEILFNPGTGGADFVELFNCSDKILNVVGWTLANKLAMTGSPRERIEEDRLLLPGGYLVFTPDPADILIRYEQAQAAFIQRNRLPSLPNDAGNISLIGPVGDTLDSYDYNEDQHSALLDDDNGVSLERVNAKAATQQSGNWFTAASSVGFATPTRINSQQRDVVMNPGGDTFFFLDEDTVSPDGDGFQDALLINYTTPGPGWNARIRIYDANGRLVRVLRRTELLAGQGSILWDATTDDAQRARTGVYVILIERFEPDGGTANERLVAVVVNE